MAEDIRGLIPYTSRDYESIMSDFWEVVPKISELWKPEADADPGVVLLKFLASVADMLGTNLDFLAGEIFGPSVSQRKNAEKLFGLIGYSLGWYVAARTEVTFTNNSGSDMRMDFGFNGSNFGTLNAYTDITSQPRVITYNVLPLTNKYGAKETRSRRSQITEMINIFSDSDEVLLGDGDSVTRVAIEGELRNYTVSVADIKNNNYIIKIPSQHLDASAVWIKAKANLSFESMLSTQWHQVASPSEFIIPEPRFAVTYDNYSNAQIQISNYLNQLENYDNNYLTIYWIDCSGVIGSVGQDVLTNFLPALPDKNLYDMNTLIISNLANTVELPHTHTVTGKSPETAKESYFNSRNYINTWDSLVTLPDYNRFLNREPGVDCAIVIDCQKALEINLAIYHDERLTDSQKSKMYITNNDFPPPDEPILDWTNVLELGFDPSDPLKHVFDVNFRPYTAMCFAIHNDFQPSMYGQGRQAEQQVKNRPTFIQYKPPMMFINSVVKDFRPLQALSVEIEFGWARIFPWYVVGEIFPKKPVTKDVANNIILKVKEDLAIFFAPANWAFGRKPTTMEVVDVVQNADSRIRYFDAGSLANPIINYYGVDVDAFNAISFTRYVDPETQYAELGISPLNNNLRINPEWIVREVK